MKKKETIVKEIMNNFDFDSAYSILKLLKLYGHETQTLKEFKKTAEDLLQLFTDDTKCLKTGYFELEVSGELDDEIEFKFVPIYHLVVK